MEAERPSGPPPVDAASGPTVLRIVVGAHLRKLREARGVTRTAAADRIRGSEAKLSRMEAGRVGFKRRDIEDLLTLYGVTDDRERDDVLALAEQANQPGWWQRYHDVIPDWLETYVGLEQAAGSIRTYEPQFVPGLVQTEEYARAVIELGRPGHSDEIKRRLSVRMGRQQQVLESAEPPSYWAIVDEAALRRPIGGPDVMRAQLQHLLAVADRPNVTLQVLPFDQSTAAIGGPFVLLRYPDVDLPDIVYLEQLTSALYMDKRADVETYLILIDRLAAAALTPRRSQALITSLRGMF